MISSDPDPIPTYKEDDIVSKKAVSSGRSMGYVSPIPTQAPRIPPEYTVVSSYVAPCGTNGGIVIAPRDLASDPDRHRKFTWTYGKKFMWWGVDRTKIRVAYEYSSFKNKVPYMVLSDSFEVVGHMHDSFDWQIAQAQCIRAHLKKELFNVELERMLL